MNMRTVSNESRRNRRSRNFRRLMIESLEERVVLSACRIPSRWPASCCTGQLLGRGPSGTQYQGKLSFPQLGGLSVAVTGSNYVNVNSSGTATLTGLSVTLPDQDFSISRYEVHD